jgi:hypothetical protein
MKVLPAMNEREREQEACLNYNDAEQLKEGGARQIFLTLNLREHLGIHNLPTDTEI